MVINSTLYVRKIKYQTVPSTEMQEILNMLQKSRVQDVLIKK